MKLVYYNLREDEEKLVEEFRKNNKDIELFVTKAPLNEETMTYAENADGVIISQILNIKDEVYNYLYKQGIKVFSTRSAGYDMYNTDLLKQYGIKLTNVPSYSPNAIGEYVLTSALYFSRNVGKIQNSVKNFDLRWDKNILSREMRSLTVGIIGTGRIGCATAKLFKGIGANVLGYDLYPNEFAKDYLTYTSLEEIYENSDIISLHMPATKDNYHMINKEIISNMKDGVILINAARGSIVDMNSVFEALNTGKIKGAAIDVYEYEGKYIRNNLKEKTDDEVLNKMIGREDILYTPHIAFYTEEALKELTINPIYSAIKVINNEECKEIVNI